MSPWKFSKTDLANWRGASRATLSPLSLLAQKDSESGGDDWILLAQKESDSGGDDWVSDRETEPGVSLTNRVPTNGRKQTSTDREAASELPPPGSGAVVVADGVAGRKQPSIDREAALHSPLSGSGAVVVADGGVTHFQDGGVTHFQNVREVLGVQQVQANSSNGMEHRTTHKLPAGRGLHDNPNSRVRVTRVDPGDLPVGRGLPDNPNSRVRVTRVDPGDLPVGRGLHDNPNNRVRVTRLDPGDCKLLDGLFASPTGPTNVRRRSFGNVDGIFNQNAGEIFSGEGVFVLEKSRLADSKNVGSEKGSSSGNSEDSSPRKDVGSEKGSSSGNSEDSSPRKNVGLEKGSSSRNGESPRSVLHRTSQLPVYGTPAVPVYGSTTSRRSEEPERLESAASSARNLPDDLTVDIIESMLATTDINHGVIKPGEVRERKGAVNFMDEIDLKATAMKLGACPNKMGSTAALTRIDEEKAKMGISVGEVGAPRETRPEGSEVIAVPTKCAEEEAFRLIQFVRNSALLKARGKETSPGDSVRSNSGIQLLHTDSQANSHGNQARKMMMPGQDQMRYLSPSSLADGVLHEAIANGGSLANLAGGTLHGASASAGSVSNLAKGILRGPSASALSVSNLAKGILREPSANAGSFSNFAERTLHGASADGDQLSNVAAGTLHGTSANGGSMALRSPSTLSRSSLDFSQSDFGYYGADLMENISKAPSRYSVNQDMLHGGTILVDSMRDAPNLCSFHPGSVHSGSNRMGSISRTRDRRNRRHRSRNRYGASGTSDRTQGKLVIAQGIKSISVLANAEHPVAAEKELPSMSPSTPHNGCSQALIANTTPASSASLKTIPDQLWEWASQNAILSANLHAQQTGWDLGAYQASQYKTKLCEAWEATGVCPLMEYCGFAHGTTELKAQPPPSWNLGVCKQGQFKTELCNNWKETGTCRYGSACRFAHGMQELRGVLRHPRYKTVPCRMIMNGVHCIYGDRCHFRHRLTSKELSLISVIDLRNPEC